LNWDEFERLTTKLNGSPTPESDRKEIFEHFGDSERRLPLEGFQKVFVIQSYASVEETFKDLAKMGFNHDLEYQG